MPNGLLAIIFVAQFVFDVTWSVEQDRGTNILSVDTGAVFQVLFIKLNAERF